MYPEEDNEYPVAQLQTNDPIVLMHSWSQGPNPFDPDLKHSFISVHERLFEAAAKHYFQPHQISVDAIHCFFVTTQKTRS